MQKFNHKVPLSAAIALALLLGGYLFSSSVHGADSVRDISKINGRVEIAADEQVGDVSLVNGSIRMASNAGATNLETVNGDIELGSHVSVTGSVTAVNGSINGAEEVQVRESLTTVNGAVTLGNGSNVGQDLQTVNGHIRLSNSRVGADLISSNGNITLADNSTVEGDVVFKGKRSWWDRVFRRGTEHRPELTIDASSVVRGDIRLYREVELHIADGADVGEIIRHYE